jgi:gliding motility-associated-like protein
MKQDSFSVITAQANTNSPLCAGDTLELTVNGGDNFMWSGPGGFSSTQQNPIILDADTFDSGIYTVEINKAGCTKSTSVSVTVNPLPTLTVSFNIPICSGKALILQATGGATFSWNGPNGFSDSVQNIAINPATPDNSGIYTVMTTDSNNCSNSVTIAIQVNPIYHDTVIADICQPETYQLGNQNYSSSGVYTDTLQTGAGCDSIITLKLGVHESPEVRISTEEASDRYCIGEEIVLSGNGADVYQWWSNFGEDYGDSGVAHVTLAQQHNIFWVAGFNKWNCSDTAEVVFDAEDCCQLFIPNAFSPNGDGRNDAFGVRTLAPPISFQLNIYNRWGQLVFSGQSEHDYWDGTFNGRPADLGVYNYRVSGKCIDGSVIARSGSITLLR